MGWVFTLEQNSISIWLSYPDNLFAWDESLIVSNILFVLLCRAFAINAVSDSISKFSKPAMIPPAQRVSSRFVLPSQPEHRSITSDVQSSIKTIYDVRKY